MDSVPLPFRVRLRKWAAQFREPVFLLSLAACAGILLADPFAPAGKGWWAAAVAASGAALWRWRSMKTLMVLVAAVFALAHALMSADPLHEEVARRLAPGAALSAVVTGVVTDAPNPGFGGSWQFPVRAERVEATATRENLPAGAELLYVRTSDRVPPPEYGDRVRLSGLLIRPAGLRNPGEFDFANYLRRQGFAAELHVDSAQAITVLESNAGNPVMAAALRSREWIGDTVTRDLLDDPDIAATVRAMVLGTREKTPREIADAFRASGTMHIFAVSGLHVALFALILWTALRALNCPRPAMVVICLALVFFYVFITGLRPSAWRAAIMLAMAMTAPLINRETALFSSLGAAALTLLGWDTRQLFQPGFSLSFGVLLAIAAIYGPLIRAMRPLYSGDPFLPVPLRRWWQNAGSWLRHRICESLAVSTAATAGAMPLMIGYFRIVTPVGILANLILVLLSLWILVFACVSLAAGLVGLSLLTVLWNNTNWALASFSIAAAKFFAAIPMGHVRVDPARLWRGSPCEITVLALDHGGAAVHIDTPAGRHWLLDSGGGRHFGRTVRPHLERTPVNRLDGLILTHRDSYHTGAAEDVTGLFRVGRQYFADGPPAANVPGDPLRLIAGDSLTLDAAHGVTMRVLFPPEGWRAGRADDRCMVARLEFGGFRILFMADAGFGTEKALLESGADLRADVLVKNRHGTDFSGLPEFLNAVQPAIVVYSHDRFPEGERVPAAWREMVAAKGIAAFDQALTGAAILRIDDAGLTARGFVNGQLTRLPPHSEPPWSAPDRSGRPVVR